MTAIPSEARADVATASGKSAGAASAQGEPRTTEQWLARVLELGAMTDAAARKQALATLLGGMDNEARAAVLEALWALNEGAGRAVFAELFTLWCEGDPAAAAKWAVTLWDEIPGREGEQLREQAAFAWAKRDFDAAFAWSLGLRDVGGEWSLAAKMLRQMAQDGDPRRALELARGVSEAFYATALNRIFAGWVEHDPAAAFAELGVACKESSMFARQLAKWADREPAMAVLWAIEQRDRSVHSLPSFVQDKGALVAALYDAKLNWAAAKYGQRLLPNYLNSWLRADQARALVWLDALPDSAEKRALIEKGAEYRGYDGSGNVITSAVPLITRLPEGEQRREFARGLLTEWGRSDPEAALRWSLELDDPVLHEVALVSTVTGLAKLDLDAARAQLETLPPGPARAQANLNLAVGWSERSGAEALRWLNETQPDWAADSWRSDDDSSGRVTLLRHALAADTAVVAEWSNALPDGAPAQFLVGNAVLQLGNKAAGGQPLKAAQALEALKPATRGMYLEAASYMILFGEHAAEARAYVERSTGFTDEEKAVLLKNK